MKFTEYGEVPPDHDAWNVIVLPADSVAGNEGLLVSGETLRAGFTIMFDEYADVYVPMTVMTFASSGLL